MTDTVQSPPPTVEVHDPLPEANWFWRRLFSFVFCTAFVAGLWWAGSMVFHLSKGNEEQAIGVIYDMFRYTVLLTFISITYYMVAPSAEQVTRMWQTAALFKQGVANTVTQVAEDAAGNKTTATTVTGPVVVPPAAPATLQPHPVGTGLPDIPQKPLTIPESTPWAKP